MADTASLPQSFLTEIHFSPCPCKPFLCPEGRCFQPDPAMGEGYYWYYEKIGMYSIGVVDLTLRQDCVVRYQQPDFISLNYFDTIAAEELSPYKRMSPNCIRGHVSNGELFQARYLKSLPIRGTELILMPGYYHDFLETRCPGEFPDPKSAFRSIDGARDFPELTLLLKQLGKFQGSGMAADLYFEGKVAEAMSLIIQRTKDHRRGRQGLSPQDLQNLEGVKEYIEDHFAFELTGEQLSAIACMGQTKLRSSFKQAYGETISQYIRGRRMHHAEYLLLKTDFNISQVAEAVGYHHPGRFSSLFQAHTGLYPEEYRKLLR